MTEKDMEVHSFHVNGMHCQACVSLIESELGGVQNVSRVKASLRSLSVEVTGEFGDKDPERIASDLSSTLKPHGYSLSLERAGHLAKWSEFKTAFPIAVGFIGLFLILQKLGVVNLITSSGVTYPTAFVIGLVASVSTCMAVVGGLLLSMSASYAKTGDKVVPQTLFHFGRLVSFFVLGGVIGAIGSAFQMGSTATLILGILIGIVMLILGLNLLDTFHWAKRLQPVLPKFVGKTVHSAKTMNHTLTPFVVGAATFFLPCGFTQSMQIFTLTTGSFITGALMMLAFALGTLPVLALLSFGSVAIHKKASSGIFFKSAGLVVIFFAVFNLLNTFAASGLIPPIFNF